MNSSLEVCHLTKSFFSNTVLKNVDAVFHPGEVHVLLGENGAGKSTILKLIVGQYPFDSGEIIYKGRSVAFSSPLEARNNGIAMIYQELTLLPEMSVLDNVFLGKEITEKGIISRKKMKEQYEKICKEYQIQLDMNEIVKNLPLSKKIMAEVLKALVIDPEVIFFDEATSALDSNEVQCLFNIIGLLKKKNRVIVFISHRMEELFEIGDVVSVLKDGEMVATKRIEDTDPKELVELMVGRTIEDVFPEKGKHGSEILLEIKDLSNEILHSIDLTVHKNEIIGIAGLKGHGQTELLNCIAGISKYQTGTITLGCKRLSSKNARAAMKDGIILVPEDRKTHGLFLNHSIARNICVSSEDSRAKIGIIKRAAEQSFIQKTVQDIEIKCDSVENSVSRLSGGNQQKVVIGRVLGISPKVVLFNEPTRGIDVKTKHEIYYRLRLLAQQGVCVIFYSSDLLEVVGISDTVYTMYEGKITKRLTGDSINEVEIMKGAVGERNE